MNKGTRITEEERIEKSTAICDMYATGQYALEVCCKQNNISGRTFENWRRDYSDISELFKKARKQKEDRENELYVAEMKKLVRESMRKKVQGYTVDLESVTMVKDSSGRATVKEKKITKKYIPPSDTIMIFNAKNLDELYENDNKIQVEHSGVIKGKDYASMSQAELDAEFEEAQRLLNEELER